MTPTPAGVIENAKRGVIRALRATFDTQYPDDVLAGVHVDMEYPVTRESYPGVWVQFSLNTIQRAGISQEIIGPDGVRYYHWRFNGRITLTVVALTSLERDRMADGLINLFAFGRYIPSMSAFSDSLNSYENVAIFLDQDALTPGGQSVNVGVPWDPDQIAYEDTYSIDCIGEFFMSTGDPTPVFLSRLEVVSSQVLVDDNPDGLGAWQ